MALLTGGIVGGVALIFVIPGVMQGFGRDGRIALAACLVFGLLAFAALMVQAIPFVRMLSRQEKAGLWLDTEVQLLDRG